MSTRIAKPRGLRRAPRRRTISKASMPYLKNVRRPSRGGRYESNAAKVLNCAPRPIHDRFRAIERGADAASQLHCLLLQQQLPVNPASRKTNATSIITLTTQPTSCQIPLLVSARYDN